MESFGTFPFYGKDRSKPGLLKTLEQNSGLRETACHLKASCWAFEAYRVAPLDEERLKTERKLAKIVLLKRPKPHMALREFTPALR